MQFVLLILIGGAIWFWAGLSSEPAYREANPVEAHLWENSHLSLVPPLEMQAYYRDGFTSVCIFPNSDNTPRGSAEFENVSIKTIVKGEESKGYLEPLFHVYWVNQSGEAIIWNLDWNRYNVKFGPDVLRKHDGSLSEHGCRADFRAKLLFTSERDMMTVTFTKAQAEP
ncbi:hypothetical protein SAMN05880593_11381 [Rhizobium sp. RU36D]|nr:hypothetical protein SAMN05880593_11381 [Rhizobium sp. RU36D]